MHRKAGASALLTVLVLAGCGAQESPEGMSEAAQAAGTMDESLTELLEAAKERSTTDFERETLDRAVENGGLTQQDYEEAFNRYQECAEAAGLQETYRKMPSGLYRLVETGSGDSEDSMATAMDANAECADGTIMRIESMYALQIGNPHMLADSRAAVIQCLYEQGHIEADYSMADFDRDMEDGMRSAPFDLADEAVDDCFYSSGFAISAQT
ncbi:hypothetical protein GCM10007079_06980 [Nocardiopsis terrae]|uniref:Lipoprotein n=1 Tax=Nocardiopsis terrae TaxID=372655 RepID=A0ABR9HNY9_9ACTN|nr:hypothetical protein [Nocardiopsis terrae]MBE1460745.1 hypothetical protein [Nocardiopsis terrae]GHC73227.1 hypothetical protein GCM10007079_06980 [Nocardiopsis terrae]